VASVAPPAAADVAAKGRVREAFAQAPPSEAKHVQIAEVRKPQRKRRIARRRIGPPVVVVAQQPQFGFFGSGSWNNTW
jgi:hypothetical protein